MNHAEAEIIELAKECGATFENDEQGKSTYVVFADAEFKAFAARLSAPDAPAVCPICYQAEPQSASCGSMSPDALCNRKPDTQPVQPAESEPVAWVRVSDITELTDSEPETEGWTPLYTSPQGAQPVPPATAWRERAIFLIHYDDQDQRPEIWTGEAAGRARFKAVGQSWNAHLFVKVASNSRDDMHANDNAPMLNAAIAQPVQPDHWCMTPPKDNDPDYHEEAFCTGDKGQVDDLVGEGWTAVAYIARTKGLT